MTSRIQSDDDWVIPLTSSRLPRSRVLNPRQCVMRRSRFLGGVGRTWINSPGMRRRGGSAREEGEPADLERHPHPACLPCRLSRALPSAALGHLRSLTPRSPVLGRGQQQSGGERVEKVSNEVREGGGEGGLACAWRVLQVTVSRRHSRYTWSPASRGFTIRIKTNTLFNVLTPHFSWGSCFVHHRACVRLRPTDGSRTDILLP